MKTNIVAHLKNSEVQKLSFNKVTGQRKPLTVSYKSASGHLAPILIKIETLCGEYRKTNLCLHMDFATKGTIIQHHNLKRYKEKWKKKIITEEA